MSSRKSIKNVVYGLLGQFIILVLGLVVPRLVLKQYSDEANGLLNAIAQVFTYLALIEAGIGQATVQSLYKPVVKGDKTAISAIMSATQRYYRKLVLVYAGAVVLLAFIYPLIIKVEDTSAINFFGSTYWAVFLLILLHGMSGAVSFYFVASYKQLFIADGQNYVISNIATISHILISVTKIVLISLATNLVVLQTTYLLINVLSVILYRYMFKKKYSYVNFKEKPDPQALIQKNSFLVHEISNAVFSSTDILLLSIFSGLEIASIYVIYNMVFSALNSLIGQVHNGCFYILGQSYNADKKSYTKVHDAYDILYISLVFTLIGAAFVLINPFVGLYTSGASDMNYVDKYLPLLFAMIQLLSCCRITASNLVKVAGHAKATIPRTVTEAVINLVASIVLVQFLGIYGVLLGTILALLYRTNDFIIYSNRKILNRSPIKQYVTIGLYFAMFAVVAFVSGKLNLQLNSYVDFIIAGAIVTLVLAICFFGLAILLNSDIRKKGTNIIKKRFTRNN